MSDSDVAFAKEQMQMYVPALREFSGAKEMWRSRIQLAQGLPWRQRAELVIRGGYEALLYGLHDRPWYIPMAHKEKDGFDELLVFCEAVEIGWRLWPDSWTGLQMILDYLAEKTCDEDVRRIPPTAIAIFEEISVCAQWPNNRLCGPMMTQPAAKMLLAKIGKDLSSQEGFERVAPEYPLAALTKAIAPLWPTVSTNAETRNKKDKKKKKKKKNKNF
eukprot:TRINITY_DN7763_c0_g1_i1.p1 TRINITY_DN7763_c0_g1~~TRINITY_DN7763_c0_g1_i1.p1  ORF type:complete len:217 (+),score=33.20 TRINITY_DN7763_c0_g1_i1:74-724(+)